VSIIADAIRVRKQGRQLIVEALSKPPGGGGKGCKIRWHPGVSLPLCEGTCKKASQMCSLQESRYGNWVHYSCRCGPPMDVPTPD
jgi:hypothetical protein